MQQLLHASSIATGFIFMQLSLQISELLKQHRAIASEDVHVSSTVPTRTTTRAGDIGAVGVQVTGKKPKTNPKTQDPSTPVSRAGESAREASCAQDDQNGIGNGDGRIG